ncbi:MAG: phosphoribosylamine--glycine ligase [Flavobacteriaceae bacterium]|nr:phosphoribosylamine--glycine ligase [Flavobacteriaceae bacterium]MBT7010708.1 phosphoribosylamine--glycine ligase [Flavobacteriaceae bacterium]MBT7320429.1 phosphoribosylamine--glycine ligase [Flavobacteriaceae bacterium]
MNILIIGSGAREHAFCWKINQSNLCGKIFVAPGNAGTSELATNLEILISDFQAIKNAILINQISLVIVGPEIPLINGITDFIEKDSELTNVLVVGPSSHGAKLEGSKEYSKEFMERHKIPTAPYKSFNQDKLKEGMDYLNSMTPPYVLKADGPAAGKGVLIINDLKEAQLELENMLVNNKFGNSGHNVVIEGFLDGIEISCFVLTDGKSYITLPNAKDYKRIGEGDTGLNTGGMGAISPVSFANEEFLSKVENKIIKPTIRGIAKEQMDYKGFVFIGIIKVENEPFVIEYNVRMGDPETQVILPRIKSDFLEMMISTANQSLNSIKLEVDTNSAATVVMVSEGYPENYEKEKEIVGIPKETKETIVFQAGTKMLKGKTVTNGGRVLSVTSIAENFKEALKKSYSKIGGISYEKKYFRKDLGFDL